MNWGGTEAESKWTVNLKSSRSDIEIKSTWAPTLPQSSYPTLVGLTGTKMFEAYLLSLSSCLHICRGNYQTIIDHFVGARFFRFPCVSDVAVVILSVCVRQAYSRKPKISICFIFISVYLLQMFESTCFADSHFLGFRIYFKSIIIQEGGWAGLGIGTLGWCLIHNTYNK